MFRLIATLFLNVARLFGVLALLAGLSLWFGFDISLNQHVEIHMFLGIILVMSVWILALMSLLRKPVLAIIAAVWVLVIPILGIMQMGSPLFDSYTLTQVLHFIFGLGGIGMAEMLGKRLRAPVSED